MQQPNEWDPCTPPTPPPHPHSHFFAVNVSIVLRLSLLQLCAAVQGAGPLHFLLFAALSFLFPGSPACRYVQQYNERDSSTWRNWDLTRMTMNELYAQVCVWVWVWARMCGVGVGGFSWPQFGLDALTTDSQYCY